jgi:hypothetical protein
MCRPRHKYHRASSSQKHYFRFHYIKVPLPTFSLVALDRAIIFAVHLVKSRRRFSLSISRRTKAAQALASHFLGWCQHFLSSHRNRAIICVSPCRITSSHSSHRIQSWSHRTKPCRNCRRISASRVATFSSRRTGPRHHLRLIRTSSLFYESRRLFFTEPHHRFRFTSLNCVVICLSRHQSRGIKVAVSKSRHHFRLIAPSRAITIVSSLKLPCIRVSSLNLATTTPPLSSRRTKTMTKLLSRVTPPPSFPLSSRQIAATLRPTSPNHVATSSHRTKSRLHFFLSPHLNAHHRQFHLTSSKPCHEYRTSLQSHAAAFLSCRIKPRHHLLLTPPNRVIIFLAIRQIAPNPSPISPHQLSSDRTKSAPSLFLLVAQDRAISFVSPPPIHATTIIVSSPRVIPPRHIRLSASKTAPKIIVSSPKIALPFSSRHTKP